MDKTTALRAAAAQFQQYAEHHLTKGDVVKYEENFIMYQKCRDAAEGVEAPRYQTGSPTKPGVYACRVLLSSNYLQDVFLTWFDCGWSYTGSDQKFRGAVSFWAGPLPRK